MGEESGKKENSVNHDLWQDWQKLYRKKHVLSWKNKRHLPKSNIFENSFHKKGAKWLQNRLQIFQGKKGSKLKLFNNQVPIHVNFGAGI